MLLTDGDRIRGLLGSYCRLVDAGDFAGVGALMARATLRALDGSLLATGADEVAAMYAGIVRLHEDGTPRTLHVVANTVLEETEDPLAARATSTYLVLQATPELPLQAVVTGTYVDAFARDGSGAWHFTERRFGVTHQGDLAHHLAPGVLR